MKRIVTLVAFGAALGVAGLATAQTPPAPPPPPAPDARPDAPPPPGGFHGTREHGHMHRPFPPPRGARFHIVRGDARMDVRCAENETMRACVDAAGALLDKLAPQAR